MVCALWLEFLLFCHGSLSPTFIPIFHKPFVLKDLMKSNHCTAPSTVLTKCISLLNVFRPDIPATEEYVLFYLISNCCKTVNQCNTNINIVANDNPPPHVRAMLSIWFNHLSSTTCICSILLIFLVPLSTITDLSIQPSHGQAPHFHVRSVIQVHSTRLTSPIWMVTLLQK